MKRIFTSVFTLMLASSLYAQSPQKFSYQAVVRDASSNLVTNQQIGIQISILQGAANGPSVYTETHAPNSNVNGLVSIEIGTGTVVSGSLAGIDWENGPYFILSETDPTGGSNYTISGTSELNSVPYALHAITAENVDDADADPSNEIQVLSISNDTIYLSGGGFVKLPAATAGFSGSYNDLTDVPVNMDTDHTDDFDGNFNSLTGIPANLDTDYTDDFDGQFSSLSGVPANLDTDYTDDFDGQYSSLTGAPTNVSTFTNDAGYLTAETDGDATNELQDISLSGTDLSITNGSTVDLSGLAPSYFDEIRDADDDTKVQVERTPDNDEVAFYTGGSNSMRLTNTNLSFPSLNSNIFVGENAGLNDNKSGNHHNIYIGDDAGRANITSQFNLAIGSSNLKDNTAGWNIAIGNNAMYNNTTGSSNLALGVYSLIANIDGTRNVAIGNSALNANTSGSYNTAVGYQAYYNNNGNNNTVIGYQAGRQSPTGSNGNVFIGHKAGYYETGSNQLVIANDWGSSDALITGDFSTKKVTIHSVLQLEPRNSAPSSPSNGEIYVNTNGHIYCYLGGVWKQLDN